MTGQSAKTYFLMPLLYSDGNCSAVPYPQTLSLYFTTEKEDDSSRVILVATGPSTLYAVWQKNTNNFINTVYEVELIQLHNKAIDKYRCLSAYCNREPQDQTKIESNGVCTIKHGISGVYGWANDDTTVSSIVNNKGPNFMNIFSLLPIFSSDLQISSYYILNPIYYQEKYIQAIVIRGLLGFTEVNIVPISDVKLYRPAKESLEVIEAYNTAVLNLKPLETVWIEAVVKNCNSRVTLTSTRIETSLEVAVFSAQALCNNKDPIPNTHQHIKKLDLQSSGTTPFSYIINPLYQLPPVHNWGELYIIDLYKLRSFYTDYVLSFTMLSANQSEITITCYKAEKKTCNEKQVVGEGEVWHHELEIKRMSPPADAIVIRASGPILVLHEVHQQYGGKFLYSELLQSTEWFSYKQAIPISNTLEAQHQEFIISLVIPSEYFSLQQLTVKDNKNNRSPQRLEDYQLIDKYSYLLVEDYTLIHMIMNRTGYNSDYVLLFELNDTEKCTKFGASVFSHGGYAYSNGYTGMLIARSH